MAPRGGRGKGKGERKKKDEKVLPLALDVRVNLPDESSHVVLKGISTDRIIDVRRMLCVNTVTCNITNYSLSHEVKGAKLNDSVDVIALKPCTLALVEEDYDEGRAVEHVRRLLDLLSSTTCFGPPPPSPSSLPSSSDAPSATEKDGKKSVRGAGSAGNRKTPTDHQCQGQPKPPSSSPPAKDSSDDLEAEISGACPRLGAFYEFFSLANLTPPVQFIRRTTSLRKDECPSDDHLFFLEVKLCNGKLVIIEACARGFYSLGKHRVLCHNLVDLLRHLSRAFDSAYEDLMKAFIKRNKFGNLPYGFRANTWLVPPVAAQLPSIFPSLPTEDEAWGGNGGGCAWDAESDSMPWVNEFLFLKSMPCKTTEERQIRDRRAFLLHSLFVDIAILRAVATVKQLIEKNQDKLSPGEDKILHLETVGDFSITVTKDALDASCKMETKIDGSKATGIDAQNLIQRNLLKGITANENTTTHDISTLGVVTVRYCGYIAIVKVNYHEESEVNLPLQGVEIKDQPNGGANALNINSLRMLLHKSHTSREKRDQISKHEELFAAQMFVEKLLKESLVKLEEEKIGSNAFMRWELGACWIQHLQDQNNSEKDKKQESGKSEKQTGEKSKNEIKVEGLGKSFKILKRPSKKPHFDDEKTSTADKNLTTKTLDGKQNVVMPFDEYQKESREAEKASMLKDLLPEPAYTRLKESNVGLEMKSLQELTEMAMRYYNEVALPKLVSDFGSLELSPVDGRTLTDFMHTRGLRMHSLGQVVKLSDKLSHVQSLCMHEMIVRAFKHIVQAVIAAVYETRDLSISLAATLNLLLGVPDAEISHHSVHVHSLVWAWLTLFLKKRYDWELTISNYQDIRKYAILRGICHKVGIELAPRDFDMDSPFPFDKLDIISLVPVHKQVACSSADGRQLLESSKAALDKGKLEDAVNYGTKALAKLIAVCGPHHRMTAGAYSLLAVVLYHTGDFNQATTYQQKALDINERDLGLDHPDTMKSYGDLAVFYYRLQHTELALKYVKRALYLLHLTCGPSHPNTAATYINVAMMEEGLGNVHVALRYLHKALKCNQKLLGPDHIQTAASYHAIAIALSLMEAYPLSVQHEQTTLQILRAKLGPDDLRTQDAAAWLEYFESKAIEQQEAARSGMRKLDASIASKGHLSVSDLLDYIDPNQDDKAKEAELLKRKNLGWKVKVLSSQNLNVADSSSKQQNQNLADDVKLVKDGTDIPDNEIIDTGHEQAVIEKHLAISQQSKCEEVSRKQLAGSQQFVETEEQNLNSISEGVSEANTEVENGWQSVQRPRSTGGSFQRIKIKHQYTNIRRSYNHQMNSVPNEMVQSRKQSSYLSKGYYLLRKRTVVPGNINEDVSKKVQSPGIKFSRKVYRAVTYRVKTLPSSTNQENSSKPRSASEKMAVIDSQSFPVDNDNQENSIPEPYNQVLGLCNSPSYKDVALAPPGTIAKIQSWKSLDDMSSTQESFVGSTVPEVKDSVSFVGHENSYKLPEISSMDQEDLVKEEVLDSVRKVEVEKEEGRNKNCDMDSPVEPLSSGLEVASSGRLPINNNIESTVLDHEIQEVQGNANCSPNSPRNASVETLECLVIAESEGNSEEASCSIAQITSDSSVQQDLKNVDNDTSEKVCTADSIVQSPISINDGTEIPSKKLSAFAMPFNPSPAPVLSPVPVSIGLPPSGAIPAVTPWPLSTSLHATQAAMISPRSPICSSPHLLYPSSPRPLNILHTFPLMYPPYTQPPVVPNSTFGMKCNMFHGDCYPWQCNVGQNAPEFVPGSVWSGSHPVDICLPPVLNPIAKPILAPAITSDISTGVSTNCQSDSNNENGKRTAANDEVIEVVEASKPLEVSWLEKHELEESQVSDTITDPLNSGTDLREDTQHDASTDANGSSRKNENQGRLSLYIKGRRRRRQTLRLPISLFNRPYESQSFKVICSRVVRVSNMAKPEIMSSSKNVNAS
ncbi:LOW QUALITY PROTEIN: protein REDUCED CHLOROPLAST COVERAGE 1-like [Curcuma longa]|uniref:LOW QUALITY PROTEIN: protein REDUCED CHLOROPLAST COVERAGE 1-like n=1 Tax=Curcuma longa TaxID=136217 RepID=UPI003D9EB39B